MPSGHHNNPRGLSQTLEEDENPSPQKTVNMTLTESHVEALDAIVVREGLKSRSEAVRWLIRRDRGNTSARSGA